MSREQSTLLLKIVAGTANGSYLYHNEKKRAVNLVFLFHKVRWMGIPPRNGTN